MMESLGSLFPLQCNAPRPNREETDSSSRALMFRRRNEEQQRLIDKMPVTCISPLVALYRGTYVVGTLELLPSTSMNLRHL